MWAWLGANGCCSAKEMALLAGRVLLLALSRSHVD